MAEAKKTTKKAATKAAPAKSLAEQLSEKQRDLSEFKRSHAANELVNPRVLTHTRKDIARLQTAISAEKQAAKKESK